MANAKKEDAQSVTQQDAGQAQLQANADKDEALGYHGDKVDPEPNEKYTIKGVLADRKK